MKEFLEGMRAATSLWSILMLLLGILLIINPGEVILAVCVIAGVILLVAGVIMIAAYMTGRGNPLYPSFAGTAMLASGLVLAVIGIFIITRPRSVVNIMGVLLFLILILHGFYEIREMRNLREYGYESWYLNLINAVITFILAFVILINPFGSAKVVMIFAGISLIFIGVSGLFGNVHISRAARDFVKKAEDKMEDMGIDVEGYSKETRADEDKVVDGEILHEEEVKDK